jgi:uncharacterized coiled-coil protein SlyX
MLTDEDVALQAIATLEQLSAEQQDALEAINTIIHNGEPFIDAMVATADFVSLSKANTDISRKQAVKHLLIIT